MIMSDRSTFDDPDRTTWASLLADVPERAEPTKSRRVQAAIREAIRDGRLVVGDRLPSSRALAAWLGTARNVVVDAYDQLLLEGYVVTQTGSGTRVALRVLDAPIADATTFEPAALRPRIDLSPGVPDLLAFPMRDWKRCVSESLDTMPADELGYTDGRGSAFLREELARYTRRVRGAAINPQRLVITTGVSAALALLTRTLVHQGRPTIAVEDPHAASQRAALQHAGGRVVGIPVDEDGMRVDLIGDVDTVLVTPAHHYPLGHVLSPGRREALIAWARARPGRLVVEDDYDAEFRFDRRPIGSLQGLAPDVVAVTSSVSKTLSPALRIGWLAVPTPLADGVATRIRAEWITPDALSQHALALLIRSGRYDRIIRARRRAYQQRRAVMVAALSTVPGCTVIGPAGGLHLTVMLPPDVDDQRVCDDLAGHGICAPPLSEYRHTPGPPGLVLSFSNLGAGVADEVAAALTAVLAASSTLGT
jgi:GntR family transcriptional regulator / MocR family aminotransferase